MAVCLLGLDLGLAALEAGSSDAVVSTDADLAGEVLVDADLTGEADLDAAALRADLLVVDSTVVAVGTSAEQAADSTAVEARSTAEVEVDSTVVEGSTVAAGTGN
jgi:hypothetical protein